MTIYRHKKRGTEYRMIGRAQLQAKHPLPDYTDLVVYQDINDPLGKMWARSEDEFYDGRFEERLDKDREWDLTIQSVSSVEHRVINQKGEPELGNWRIASFAHRADAEYFVSLCHKNHQLEKALADNKEEAKKYPDSNVLTVFTLYMDLRSRIYNILSSRK